MKMDKFTDREIVAAILDRDTVVTKEYLYKKCYPLFKSIYDKYFTDCENCLEFIDEIYLYIMTPRRDTLISKLASFEFRCTLTLWLKIVSENFCHQLYARRKGMFTEPVDFADGKVMAEESLEGKMQTLDVEDANKIVGSMPNERYRKLIGYRYLEGKTNEETAALLASTLSNYYNMHLRAKAQLCTALRKEGLI